MGLADFGLPERLVEFLAGEFKIGEFFETGTYYGASSLWAAQRFAKVTTVERAPILYSIARVKLGRCANVTLVFGDSREALEERLPGMPPTLFWLDAHWSGGHTAGEGVEECPLLGELALIAPALDRHFVLIDDARLFAMPPPPPNRIESWPCLADVFDVLRSRHRPYIVIYRDVIVAVPEHARPALVEFLRREAPEESAPPTPP
jgi:hypothetical protein